MGEYKSPKKPKFRWDDHRRQVLCCLYRFFSRDEDDFKRVFSEIFREHLVECGFEDGTIPYRVLYTQWMWMRRVEHPIWCQVHLESAFKSDGKCEDTIQVIKSTANWLGISLVERDHDPVDMSQHNSLISDKKAIQILESVLIKNGTDIDASIPFDDSPLDYDQIHADAPATQNGTIFGKPCFWCHREGRPLSNDEEKVACPAAVHDDSVHFADPRSSLMSNHQAVADLTSKDELTPVSGNTTLPGLCSLEDLPPILYRWSNLNSQGDNGATGLKAGLFADRNSTFFPPEDLTEQSFLEYFTQHVTKAKVKTPFISTFKSPLAPIHRSLHNGDEAKVTVVDTSKLDTKVFKAAPLVGPTNTATPTWKGYGEYLIWGQVSTAAIICTFPITKLQRIAAAHSDIGDFLQLPLISSRWHCSRFLYSDIATNLPETDDDYAKLLQRLTTLLGVPEGHRSIVADGFREAWTRKFSGLHYQKPKTQATDPHAGDEASDSVQVFCLPRLLHNMATPSEPSLWQPSDNENDDSRSVSSEESGPRASEEPEAKCLRYDTPSDVYSLQDDSSVDWRIPKTVDDEVEDEDEEEQMTEDEPDEEDEWPSDVEIYVEVPVRW